MKADEVHAGVRVCCICPGGVDTDALRGAKQNQKELKGFDKLPMMP